MPIADYLVIFIDDAALFSIRRHTADYAISRPPPAAYSPHYCIIAASLSFRHFHTCVAATAAMPLYFSFSRHAEMTSEAFAFHITDTLSRCHAGFHSRHC